jgi:hypothetical protein
LTFGSLGGFGYFPPARLYALSSLSTKSAVGLVVVPETGISETILPGAEDLTNVTPSPVSDLVGTFAT